MKFYNREPVYTCGACRDTGRVEVWHPATIRFFREEFAAVPPQSWSQWDRDPRWKEYAGPKYRSVVLTCNCGKGQIERKTKLVVYDADKHCLFDPMSGEGLHDWLNREHCYDPVTGEYASGLSPEF